MNFKDPAEVEAICYDLKLGDWPRAKNRQLINQLFNGVPPYDDNEVEQNKISVNVNFLESTKLAHDARAQFYGAFMKPGNYFRARPDTGPKHKRQQWGEDATRFVNRIMKRSMDYYECFRSRFALDVLHGVGPASWNNSDVWCPEERGIEDILIPSRTRLTMKNLPFFAVYKSWTANELIRLTRGPKNPGWNMKLVNELIRWIDRETMNLMGTNWPEVWSPEKLEERIKGDGGFYSTDQCPTIDVFDFYYWNDEGDEEGWSRRIILDSWSTPQADAGGRFTMGTRLGKSDGYDGRGHFLFDSGTRKYGSKLSELLSFQFADLSAVAPFQYHSVRSLGFLLYAICQLQNRLRCRFNEAVFEGLLMYFRVKSADDVQRALKIQLANHGIVDESIQFIPREERWQPDVSLAELGMNENQRIINDHASTFTTASNMANQKIEKTKFQVMAEVNATTTLVSTALQQAYRYQEPEYREIWRRFCKKNSKDVEVQEFRANCLRSGIPASALLPEAWDIEPERVTGAGNKTLELAIAEQLMQFRPLFDPQPQREILRLATLNITDDPALTNVLVPKGPEVTDSVHDTELAFGSLMQGSMVTPKPGLNAVEVCSTMLKLMAARIRKVMQSGGMGTPDEVQGLTLCGQYVASFLAILAQDKESKPIVKKIGDMMGKLMNEVKAMAQRQQQAQQKAMQQQAQTNGGVDPKDMAKIKAMQITAQAKAENMRESHAQRTAQRQLQFEQEQRQDAQKHQAELQKLDLEAAGNIKRPRLSSTEE